MSATGAIWEPLPSPAARQRLLCFPYAGSGANVFRGWERELGPDVEVAAVQLPGREWRRGEPPHRTMDDLLDRLIPEVSTWLDDPRPSAFFGYSMGAALSFALAARLQAAAAPGPGALFVAACRAPHLLQSGRPLHRLDDGAFLETIRALGGVPEAVVNEPELLDLAMPVLRADFDVLGSYAWRPAEPLRCPITVYGGTSDRLATRAELAGWKERTGATFRFRIFTGGHFFIHGARQQLLRTLGADLATSRTADAG